MTALRFAGWLLALPGVLLATALDAAQMNPKAAAGYSTSSLAGLLLPGNGNVLNGTVSVIGTDDLGSGRPRRPARCRDRRCR